MDRDAVVGRTGVSVLPGSGLRGGGGVAPVAPVAGADAVQGKKEAARATAATPSWRELALIGAVSGVLMCVLIYVAPFLSPEMCPHV